MTFGPTCDMFRKETTMALTKIAFFSLVSRNHLAGYNAKKLASRFTLEPLSEHLWIIGTGVLR